MPNLIINKISNAKLQDLSKKRKATESAIKTKKGITEELIDKAHRRECK